MGCNVFEKQVKDIVSRDTVTLSASETIHDALSLMGENGVSALPVVDNDNRCIGMLSASDLIDLTRDTDDDLRELDVVDLSTKRFLIDKLAHSLGSESVQTFMSESPITVDLKTSISGAAKKMVENQIHHLPVVDHNEHLVGIISTMDILGEFIDADEK